MPTNSFTIYICDFWTLTSRIHSSAVTYREIQALNVNFGRANITHTTHTHIHKIKQTTCTPAGDFPHSYCNYRHRGRCICSTSSNMYQWQPVLVLARQWFTALCHSLLA